MELTLGCAQDVPLQRLQAFLGLLYERCGDIDVEVRHLTSAQQLERLQDGDLDLGLVHDGGHAHGVGTERLYYGEALSAVVALTHRVAALESARMEDLARDVLFVVSRHAEPALHDRIVALTASNGVAMREVPEGPGPGLRDLLFAVASGRGVTIAPRATLNVAGDLRDAVAARPLFPPAWMPDTCLAWRADARPELRGVYAAAREVARRLYRS